MSQTGGVPPYTARYIRLRRRVIIAGLSIAVINTVLVYANIIAGRSRAALQVLTDLNASFSQSTINHARPCIRYVNDTFDETDLKKLWSSDDFTFSLKEPTTASSKVYLSICISDLPTQQPAQLGPQGGYYLRRQVLGYLNVHEIAYSALITNNADNYQLCAEWGEITGTSPLEILFAKLISAQNIGAAAFSEDYPALYTFYKDRPCSNGWWSRAFRNYIGFLLPFGQHTITPAPGAKILMGWTAPAPGIDMPQRGRL